MVDRHRGTRILVAEHAGVCYGVERALQLTYDAARDARQPVRTLRLSIIRVSSPSSPPRA